MLKEIKLSPNISLHDIEYRIRQANKFLQKGNQVKVTLQFKGREKLHQDIGMKTLLSFISQCEGKLASQVKKSIGRGVTLSIVLNPKGK